MNDMIIDITGKSFREKLNNNNKIYNANNQADRYLGMRDKQGIKNNKNSNIVKLNNQNKSISNREKTTQKSNAESSDKNASRPTTKQSIPKNATQSAIEAINLPDKIFNSNNNIQSYPNNQQNSHIYDKNYSSNNNNKNIFIAAEEIYNTKNLSNKAYYYKNNYLKFNKKTNSKYMNDLIPFNDIYKRGDLGSYRNIQNANGFGNSQTNEGVSLYQSKMSYQAARSDSINSLVRKKNNHISINNNYAKANVSEISNFLLKMSEINISKKKVFY